MRARDTIRAIAVLLALSALTGAAVHRGLLGAVPLFGFAACVVLLSLLLAFGILRTRQRLIYSLASLLLAAGLSLFGIDVMTTRPSGSWSALLVASFLTCRLATGLIMLGRRLR